MTFQFVESVMPQLCEMERMIDKEIKMRAGHVSHFTNLELDRVDKYLYPAALLATAKMFGAGTDQRNVPLAAVTQFIRIATKVHSYNGKAPQYPVLVGDYLYSHFFLYLSRYRCLELLAPLSLAICEIHEGGIIRKDVLEEGKGSEKDYATVAQKECGRLLAESCAIGAIIGGADEKTINDMRAYGLSLGTAWGLIRSKFDHPAPESYLRQAAQALDTVPDNRERQMFVLTVETMMNKPEVIKKFMAG